MLKRSCLILLVCATISAQEVNVDKTQLLADLKMLSSDEMEGRKLESSGSKKARSYIVERFNQTGIEPFLETFEQPFTFSYQKDKTKTKHQGINVVGFIKGVASDKMIVVTAHYDHLGIHKGEIYNGADDNASGVAALFAIGSYFSKNPPRNSILIAALDAEEIGAAGGSYLVQSLDREKIMLNVNLDMVGRDKNNVLYAAGTHYYPQLKSYLEKVATRSPVKLLFGHDRPNLKGMEDWTRESDHYAFHVRGIPFVYFGVEDFEYHHKPDDEYESMTHDFFGDAVETILMALLEFDANL